MLILWVALAVISIARNLEIGLLLSREKFIFKALAYYTFSTLKAICLSYDRNRTVMDFVIHTYGRLWPDHPFIFHVPYNDEYPSELKEKYGDRVVLCKTPSPIKETIVTLLDSLDDNEWVWWCLDDKYPITMDCEALRAIHDEVIQIKSPRVWGVMVTPNTYSLRRSKPTSYTLADIPMLRKRDYAGFWQPHFVRVKTLKRYMIDNRISGEKYINREREEGLMPDIDELTFTRFPFLTKVYMTRDPLLTFGETLTMGKLTVNLVAQLREEGLSIPPLPLHDKGWITTQDKQIQRF